MSSLMTSCDAWTLRALHNKDCHDNAHLGYANSQLGILIQANTMYMAAQSPSKGQPIVGSQRRSATGH